MNGPSNSTAHKDQQPLPSRQNYFASAYPRNVSPMVAFQCPPPKKSLSFLSMAELVSFKTIPILGACCYVSTSIGALAMDRTFEVWFGSEYTANKVMTGLTLGSWLGFSCYIYGRRHIRHAGAFEKIIFPTFTTTFFIAASHFSWAFIKESLSNQNTFDHNWKVLAGISTGLMFLYTGKSYLRFIDHW